MPVTLEVSDCVAVVTLNRPEALNAIDPESASLLRQAWNEIGARDDVRVGILTGAGERAFSAGVDLKKAGGAGTPATKREPGAELVDPPMSMLHTSKPMIAAINGMALGGGLELALQCDIRIAANHAVFGFPEVRVGTIAAGGGTQRLARLVSESDAMMLLLTGDRIDAHEALRMGVISRVVPLADLQEAARSIALRIARNAPLAVAATRTLVTTGRELPLEAALELEQQAFARLFDSEDRIEGRRAFAEKREPVFRGR